MKLPPLSRPIFIVGAPRSGTTLLQCVLSVSPAVFTLPETHFFSFALPQTHCRAHDPITLETYTALAHALASEAGLNLSFTYADMLHRFGEAACVLDVFRALAEQYRPEADSERMLRLLEKTPLHVYALASIRAAFPDAFVINLVRQPLDVVSSWRRAPFAASRAVSFYARQWKRAASAARAFELRWPAQILSLRYEDLIQHPEATVRGVCERAGIAFMPEMLTEFGAQLERHHLRREAWFQNVISGQIVNRIGAWREGLTESEAWLVEQMTQRERERLGYPAQIALAWPGRLSILGQEAWIWLTEFERWGLRRLNARGQRHA